MDKKWLIGCGGCLGVVLVIVVAVAGLGYWGVDTLVKGSAGATSAIFGETAPEGYMAMFGMKDDTGEGTTMVMMVGPDSGNVLIGLETPADKTEMEAFQSGDPEKLKPLINKALSNGGDSVDNLQTLGMDTLNTTAGNVLAIRLSATSNSGKTTPALVSLLPLQNSRLKLAILINGNTRSSRSDALFEEDFELMLRDMTDLINGTDIAQNIIPLTASIED